MPAPERQRSADLKRDLGWHYVDASPDRRPAVCLRRELERDRELGIPFDDIWLEECAFVTSKLTKLDAEQWREAFSATESAWRAGYDKSEAHVSRLAVELLNAA